MTNESTILDRWSTSGQPSVDSFNHAVDVANANCQRAEKAEAYVTALRLELERLRSDLAKWIAFREGDTGVIERLQAFLETHKSGAATREEALYDRIRTREAEAASPPAPSGWQPIESAPKDGSEVLLRVKMRAGIPGGSLVGHWMPGGHCIQDHPPIDDGWYFWNGCMFDIAAEPTHWMPLPAAPGAKDPNAAAVNAQLDPLKAELVDIGHTLAKETR